MPLKYIKTRSVKILFEEKTRKHINTRFVNYLLDDLFS